MVSRQRRWVPVLVRPRLDVLTRHLQTLAWTPDEAEHPAFIWKTKGWEVGIGLKLKSTKTRVKADRPLAIWFGKLEQSTMPGQLRTKLDDEGRKYGDLDLPLVVALESLGYSDWREWTTHCSGSRSGTGRTMVCSACRAAFITSTLPSSRAD